MKKKILFILFISGCFLTGSNAQSIAVKSNLLYDATSTLNMGVELGLSRQWTLDVPLNYNPWKPGNGRRLRHWGIQPEARYWFCAIPSIVYGLFGMLFFVMQLKWGYSLIAGAFTPVSYTHLDVYKRQILNGGLQNGKIVDRFVAEVDGFFLNFLPGLEQVWLLKRLTVLSVRLQ